MARPKKVWFRSSDQCWYATIRGVKTRLTDKGDTKERAEERWHELMARANAPTLQDFNPFKVVAEEFLDYVEANHPPSLRRYKFYLQSFVDAFPGVLVKDIKAVHVRWWHEKHPTWGETTRHDSVTTLLATLNWAAKPEVGLITKNPIRGLSRGPAHSRGAEALIDPGDFDTLYKAANPCLQKVLFALRQTGQRPVNVCRIEARHCDFAHDVVVLPKHKTSGRTGRALSVPMTGAFKGLLVELAAKYPEGPLFRTRRGRPYTSNYVSEHVGRLQKRLRRQGVVLKGHVIAYGVRHTTATDLLEAGVPDAKVAAILGHTNTTMIYRHYSHLGSKIQSLRGEMERVINGGGGKDGPGR